MRPKSQQSWLNLPHWQMFSTPQTSVHLLDKNREISPLGREEGYGWKDLEKRRVLRREWKTLWDTPTTDLGAESEPGNGGEHSEEADWQGTRRDWGSLFHRWGAAYRKEIIFHCNGNMKVIHRKEIARRHSCRESFGHGRGRGRL